MRMDRTAEIAFGSLSPNDRKSVNTTLSRLRNRTLAGRPYRSFGRTSVKKLEGGMYLTTVQQRLGILFREIEGDLVVHDIFPAGRLDAIYGSKSLVRAG